MTTILALIEQFIKDKQLGLASVDRDFSTLQETNIVDLENWVLSLKRWKWLQLQREFQSPEIAILIDLNCNLIEHFRNNKKNNPIFNIINFFSLDYNISIQTIDQTITDDRYYYIMQYASNFYESSIDRMIAKANTMLDNGIVVIVVSDFLNCSSDVSDLLCIQIQLPICSSHYHDYYVESVSPLQTEYLYVW